MKKIFVAIFVIFSFATYADTTLTSKNYVDSQVATKQDIISAKNTNTVLTHSGELGNIGEKKIYNSTGAYAGHSTELVTAGVADSAIQNAIDTEFVCVEWYENDAHTDENCLGWQIQNVTQRQILPNGYTQLEYIESDGTQYINTGIKYAQNTLKATYDIDFQITRFNSNGGGLWGTIISRRVGMLWYRSNGKFATSMGNTVSGNSHIQIPSDTNRHHVIFEGGLSSTDNNIKLTFDGNSYIDTYNYGDGSMLGRGFDIYLFVGYSISLYPPTAMKLYSFKIWLDNDLKRDFIPAKNGNVVGMYDLVSGQFFTNDSGTGTFVAGPVTSSNLYIPSGN